MVRAKKISKKDKGTGREKGKKSRFPACGLFRMSGYKRDIKEAMMMFYNGIPP
jgi:hypothetical protein